MTVFIRHGMSPTQTILSLGQPCFMNLFKINPLEMLRQADRQTAHNLLAVSIHNSLQGYSKEKWCDCTCEVPTWTPAADEILPPCPQTLSWPVVLGVWADLGWGQHILGWLAPTQTACLTPTYAHPHPLFLTISAYYLSTTSTVQPLVFCYNSI